MIHLRTGIAACIALGGAIATLPAEAQTVRRHLQCFAVPPIGVGGVLGGPNIQQRAIITNNIGATIPGNTTYTYAISGRQLTHRQPSALAPGQQINVPGLVGGNATTCDAWILVVAPRPNLNTAPPATRLYQY
jgi:hypothetical protein